MQLPHQHFKQRQRTRTNDYAMHSIISQKNGLGFSRFPIKFCVKTLQPCCKLYLLTNCRTGDENMTHAKQYTQLSISGRHWIIAGKNRQDQESELLKGKFRDWLTHMTQENFCNKNWYKLRLWMRRDRKSNARTSGRISGIFWPHCRVRTLWKYNIFLVKLKTALSACPTYTRVQWPEEPRRA